eukprot:superscaffoldBa00001466_g10686
MSAVTNQPLPIGQLEREKHIQMIFRAFQNRCGPSCESHNRSPGPKPGQTPPDWASAEQLSGPAPEMKIENGHVEPTGKLNQPEEEEQWLEGAEGSDSLTVLDTVSQIHITARPELQGPQCVPRRIYSIATGASRWSMFTPLLEVWDSEGASTIRIQGSCCPCRCFSNQQFQIVSNIGEKIGTIWKKWPGFNDERNMDHEYFGLEGEFDLSAFGTTVLIHV